MTQALEGLRRATREIHDRLHHHPAFAPLMGTPSDVGGYVRLLGQLWGFHVPVESGVFAAAARLLPELDDLAGRRKAHLLEADLAAFAPSFPDLPHARAMFAMGPPASRPAVLGCLYVVEGATLGGRELGRALGPVLAARNMAEPAGRQFLLAYGARQGAMWRYFCEILARAAARFSCAEHRAMEAAARDLFLAMENWLTSGPDKSVVNLY